MSVMGYRLGDSLGSQASNLCPYRCLSQTEAQRDRGPTPMWPIKREATEAQRVERASTSVHPLSAPDRG